MVDIVPSAKRSQMMTRIRGKDTVPEVRVRRLLHARGFRFRLHRRDLPGSPDIVLPRHNVAIFVNGCFWHFHRGCGLAKIPASRREFWSDKLIKNRERDTMAVARLIADGWRVLVVWECYLRETCSDEAVTDALARWILHPSADVSTLASQAMFKEFRSDRT